MDIKNVVVAGGGTLGSQIAYQTAYRGFNVKVWLRSEGSIDRAKPKFERIRDIYLGSLEEMKKGPVAYYGGFTDSKDLSDEEIDELKEKAKEAYEKIEYITSYEEAFKDADLVIEAIAEIPEEKINFYQEIDKHLPEDAIIVTNTSTLLPSMFAEYTGRPEKYLALHFANGIWLQNTAEVMGHPGTEDKYYDRVVEFAEDIGMVPLELKKEQPGYLLNSMLVPLLSAAESLLANEVADFETIDKTWKIATGSPAGPFEILDKVGLTTAYNIANMRPDGDDPESDTYKVKKILKEYIDAGKTGVNAGEGFYKYK